MALVHSREDWNASNKPKNLSSLKLIFVVSTNTMYSEEAVEAVTRRLAPQRRLILPVGITSLEDRVVYIKELLSVNPKMFLESYGVFLTVQERQLIDSTTTISDKQVPMDIVRYRRLAAMKSLESEGYFSEYAVKSRNPRIYHKFVGRHRPPTEHLNPPRPPNLGGDLTDSTSQRHEELDIILRRLVALEDHSTLSSSQVRHIEITEEERADYAGMLADEMKYVFLKGLDPEADYDRIDKDTTLDSEWEEQYNRDMEDKYFDI